MQLSMSEPGDDRELAVLLERARGGSAPSFDELVRRVRRRVRAWARHLTRDADDAEDVAQVVLLTLYARLGELGRLGGRGRLTAWLYRVTRNAALDRRRAEARRAAILARRTPDAATAEESDMAGEDAERLARLVREGDQFHLGLVSMRVSVYAHRRPVVRQPP